MSSQSALLYIYDLWPKNKCLLILKTCVFVNTGEFPDIFGGEAEMARANLPKAYCHISTSIYMCWACDTVGRAVVLKIRPFTLS